MITRIHFRGFLRALLPDGWGDITSSVEAENPPITFARLRAGNGALQISPAMYESGTDPRITTQLLQSLLNDFGKTRRLGVATQRACTHESLKCVSATFRSDGDFICVWYLSDGRNIVLATYICEWESRDKEMDDCDAIVSSIVLSSKQSRGKRKTR